MTRCKYTLLPGKSLAIMMTISLCGLVLAVSVIIVQALGFGDMGGFNYRAAVMEMSIGDILYSIRTLFLCLADIAYGQSYFEYEFIWMKSSVCFICAGLFIFHVLVSHFAIYILAISRLQVTKHPFDSKFIEKIAPRFLLKILLFVNAASFIISIIVILIYWSSNDHFQNGLCILLGNIRESHFSFTGTIITLISNIISLFLVPLCYYIIYTIVKRTEMVSSNYKENINKFKQIALSFVNHTYWVASSIFIIFILIWKGDTYTILVWLNTLILAIGSIINPFAFTHAKVVHKVIKCVCHKRDSVDKT